MSREKINQEFLDSTIDKSRSLLVVANLTESSYKRGETKIRARALASAELWHYVDDVHVVLRSDADYDAFALKPDFRSEYAERQRLIESNDSSFWRRHLNPVRLAVTQEKLKREVADFQSVNSMPGWNTGQMITVGETNDRGTVQNPIMRPLIIGLDRNIYLGETSEIDAGRGEFIPTIIKHDAVLPVNSELGSFEPTTTEIKDALVKFVVSAGLRLPS